MKKFYYLLDKLEKGILRLRHETKHKGINQMRTILSTLIKNNETQVNNGLTLDDYITLAEEFTIKMSYDYRYSLISKNWVKVVGGGWVKDANHDEVIKFILDNLSKDFTLIERQIIARLIIDDKYPVAIDIRNHKHASHIHAYNATF